MCYLIICVKHAQVARPKPQLGGIQLALSKTAVHTTICVLPEKKTRPARVLRHADAGLQITAAPLPNRKE
eukprot:3125190-Lingulodinium_polyedra.AAC.1